MTTGAGANKVLTTDVSGVASWQTPAAGGTNYWTLSGTNLFPTSTSYNVGIGTTAPVENLDVNGEARFRQSGGNGGGPIEISDRTGANAQSILWNSYYDGTWKHRGTDYVGNIGFDSTGNLLYYSGGSGTGDTALSWTEKFRITNGGNVGIGKTNPGTALDVAGTVTATGFYYASDESLKKNIQDIETPLAKIMKLDGISFDWKESGKKSIGLIAQDVEKVFPEIVNTDEGTGLKSIEYGKLVAPLIEAVKEQQKMIDEQKELIEKQGEEIKKLKALFE